MAAFSLEQMVDSGWDVEEEPRRKTVTTTGGRSPERLEQLIREALTILDGVEPDEVPLAGDGWSLVDPETTDSAAPGRSAAVAEAVTDGTETPDDSTGADAAVRAQPEIERGPLSSAIGEALDAAFGDGWLLPDEG